MISIRQQKREAELESTRITQAKADMRWNNVSKNKDPLAMHEVFTFLRIVILSQSFHYHRKLKQSDNFMRVF